MDENTIDTQIQVLKTALQNEGLGEVYDHIPAKPSFPCVIIAPATDFITEDDNTAITERKLNLDIWLVTKTSTSNKDLQQSLYKNIAKAITKLETIDEWIFDTVAQPQPVEYNQARALSSTITGAFII